MALPTLGPGDVAYTKSLSVIVESGPATIEASFKPQRGFHYAVLVLGAIPKDMPMSNEVDEVMGRLGWVRKPVEKKCIVCGCKKGLWEDHAYGPGVHRCRKPECQVF